jgi:hypothetical protein
MLNQPRHIKQKWADTFVETAGSNMTVVDLFERVAMLESGADQLNTVNEGIVHRIRG